jgi:hypothetical protein
VLGPGRVGGKLNRYPLTGTSFSKTKCCICRRQIINSFLYFPESLSSDGPRFKLETNLWNTTPQHSRSNTASNLGVETSYVANRTFLQCFSHIIFRRQATTSSYKVVDSRKIFLTRTEWRAEELFAVNLSMPSETGDIRICPCPAGSS